MTINDEATARRHPDARIAAILLAGGRARRLGRPKPSATVGDETLLNRGLRGLAGVPTAVIGPPELGAIVDGHPDARLTQESPPFSGPVAGIEAGWSVLSEAGTKPDWLLLLACDLPRAPEAIRRLLGEVPELDAETAGACLATDGQPQWLCGIYRAAAVDAGLEALRRSGGVESAAMRALLGPLVLRHLADPERLGFDIDTPEQLRAANAAEERTGP